MVIMQAVLLKEKKSFMQEHIVRALWETDIAITIVIVTAITISTLVIIITINHCHRIRKTNLSQKAKHVC